MPITDAARAKSFYAEKLGLKFVSEDSFAVVFDANGNMLRLTLVKEFTPQPFTILGWEVADIEATVKQLQAAGVTFERYGDFMKQDELGIWTPRTERRWPGLKTRTATSSAFHTH